MQLARPERRLEHARSCVGCGVRVGWPVASFELVRFALQPKGGGFLPRIDLAGSAPGRGAWCHPSAKCLQKAAHRGLSRSARAQASCSPAALAEQIAAAAAERAHLLIGVAARARKAIVGASGAELAAAVDGARVVLVAVDAASVDRGLAAPLARGQAIAFGTTASLAAACGRPGAGSSPATPAVAAIAFVGVADPRLAAALRQAVALSLAAASMRSEVSV